MHTECLLPIYDMLVKIRNVGSQLIVDATKLYAGAAAIVVSVALFVFFRFSLIGKAIRACADNYTGALVVGLNVNHLYALTFGVGAACVGAAGTMMTLITMFPTMTGSRPCVSISAASTGSPK